MSAQEQDAGLPMLPADAVVDHPPLSQAELELAADVWADGPDAAANAVGATPADTGPGYAPLVWHPQSEAQAEWCLRKLQEARAELEHVEWQMAGYMESLARWQARATRAPLGTVAFMESRLELYARRYREATGKATLRLPSGDVATTDRKPRPVIQDQQLLLEWCLVHHPEAVHTDDPKPPRQVVYADAARALGQVATVRDPDLDLDVLVFVTPDGERIPGMGVEPGGVDAKVKG